MLDLFGTSIIAIDIGSSSVKIAEIGGMHKQRVQRLGLEVLPTKVIEDGAILNRDALKDTIKNLLKKLKIITIGKNAGVSLSGGAVIIKRVNLSKPHTDPDFYEYLYHEAEQYLQYDVAELYVDWAVLPNISGEQGSSVLLVGAKRNVVEEYTTLMESIGLKVSIVDCDALAGINTVSSITKIPNDLSVVADVGYSSTQVSLLIDGHFVFTREIAIGGNNYSVKMVELMGLDFESAETVKITMSNGDRAVSEECENIINEINASLAHELNATIEYYFQSGETSIKAMRPTKVYLLGGGAKTIGLDKTIEEILQTSTERIDPFHGVSINNKSFSEHFINQQGHLFGVSMGLCLRKLNDKKAA